jgi:hypothetical protein
MRLLNSQEQNTIEQFFQLYQSSLLKVMKHYLKSKYDRVITTKDYIVAVGDIPVALVAHADTVFKKPPQRIFYDKQKNVMWSPEGLGADDRAGVFAIIQIIKSGLRPTVIITTDEEKGGIGASALVRNMPKPPTDLKYIIQLDRQGSMDCVFYDCLNKDFEKYVESFGFVTDFGSFSDISVLCPAWKVAGVNLSIGYYDEHSVSETLYIGHMNSTILKVKNMLRDAKRADSYIYIENPRKKWFRYSYPTEDDNYGWDPSWGISKEEWMKYVTTPMHKCNQCGTWEYENNLVPTKAENGETVFFCDGCASTHRHLHICANCGEAFLDKTHDFAGEAALCKDCRGKR